MKIPVGFTVFPTERCNRGCKHCFTRSTEEGNTIAPKTLKQWARKVAKLDWPVEVTLTGFGEPILYPWLPELVTLLLSNPNQPIQMTLVTSGCLNQNDTGFEVLEELVLHADPRLRFNLSFSTYNSSLAERLRFTIPLISEVGSRLLIQFTWDIYDQVTPLQLDKLLGELGYQLRLSKVRPQASFTVLDHALRRVPEDWESGKEAFGLYLSYFGIREYVNEEGNVVIVRPQTLGIEGRAADNNLNILDDEPSIAQGPCCHLWPDETLYIGAEGFYLPCPAQHHRELLSLGAIDRTDIAVALGKQAQVKRVLASRWLSFTGITEDRCENCFW